MSWDVAALRKSLLKLADRLGYGGWKEIGEAAGLHPSGVGRVAKGETVPTYDSWKKLYEAFPNDIPPPWMTTELNEGPPGYEPERISQRKPKIVWIVEKLSACEDSRLVDDIQRRIEEAIEKKQMMEELRTLRGMVKQSQCETAMGDNPQ